MEKLQQTRTVCLNTADHHRSAEMAYIALSLD